MKKFLVLSLVAVMSLVVLTPVLAMENEGNRSETMEVKNELKLNEVKNRLREVAKALKMAPRTVSLVGTLVSVSPTTTPSSTMEITINVTKVLPAMPKHWSSATVAYPKTGVMVLKLNPKATLLRGYGGKMNLSEMAPGDEVRVEAKFTKEGILEVKLVKDNSLHIILRRGGVVESIGANSFVLKQPNRTVTVNWDAKTKFFLQSNTASFADLKVGDSVKVRGIINLNAKTVDASAVTIQKRAVAPVVTQ